MSSFIDNSRPTPSGDGTTPSKEGAAQLPALDAAVQKVFKEMREGASPRAQFRPVASSPVSSTSPSPPPRLPLAGELIARVEKLVRKGDNEALRGKVDSWKASLAEYASCLNPAEAEMWNARVQRVMQEVSALEGALAKAPTALHYDREHEKDFRGDLVSKLEGCCNAITMLFELGKPTRGFADDLKVLDIELENFFHPRKSGGFR